MLKDLLKQVEVFYVDSQKSAIEIHWCSEADAETNFKSYITFSLVENDQDEYKVVPRCNTISTTNQNFDADDEKLIYRALLLKLAEK